MTPEEAQENVNAMMARGVRRALLEYSDTLTSAIRAEVPAETLLSWGIPWADIERVLYAKGRLMQPLGAARSVMPAKKDGTR